MQTKHSRHMVSRFVEVIPTWVRDVDPKSVSDTPALCFLTMIKRDNACIRDKSKHIINYEQLMHMILFLDHYMTTNYILRKTERISARPTRV